jgi:hypothetical protein
MTAWTRSAGAMLPDCLAADDLAAAARRTGVVKRASKMTGTLLLALVPVGVGREAQPPWAQWAATVPQVEGHVDVSPEALQQRMHKRALAFLQAMRRQA